MSKETKPKKKKKIIKIAIILGVILALFLTVYSLFGKDLMDLKKLVKNNPEAEEFADHYFKNLLKKPDRDISAEVKKGEIPHFLQWDERWGYETYGSSMLALSGCGPTCLSMVYSGLTGKTDMNPLEMSKFSKKNGYYSMGTGTSWALMQDGAAKLGLQYKEVVATENAIKNRLKEGKPIICSVKKGDFTTTGHFIVLVGLNEDGTIKVNDPNSRIKSEKGWDVSVILPQIRAMWAYWVE